MSAQDPSGAPAERRLVLLVSAVVFVDTMFYAVVAPLLPSLAHDLHLSKLSAGLLTASYAAGTLIGSLPAGVLVVRAGPRFAVCLGLVLLACSTVAFGFLHDVVMLDAARFVEGVGGACSWAGGLAWIVAETPPERRGGLIGRALGAAIGGALFGPAIGTVATALGRGPTFSVLVLIAFGLIEGARRLESRHEASEQGIRQLASALRDRQVAVGVWLVTLPSIASAPSTSSAHSGCIGLAPVPPRSGRRFSSPRRSRPRSARRSGRCRTGVAGSCRSGLGSPPAAGCCCASRCPEAQSCSPS